MEENIIPVMKHLASGHDNDDEEEDDDDNDDDHRHHHNHDDDDDDLGSSLFWIFLWGLGGGGCSCGQLNISAVLRELSLCWGEWDWA